MQHPFKQLGSQGDQHRLRHLCHQNGTHHGRNRKQQRYADQSCRRREDHPLFFLIKTKIGEFAQKRRREGRHACRANEKDAGERNEPLIWEKHAKEADKIRIQTIRKNAPQEVHAASSCSPLALMP